MNIVDIVLIILLLWAAWKGFSRGLVIEVASLVALLLGIYAALNFSGYAAGIIQEYVDMEARVLRIVSFAVTFLVVMLVVILLGKILEKLVNLVLLGFLNKLFGAIFGVLKVAAVLSVLIMLMNLVDPGKKLLTEETRQESFLFQPVEKIVPLILDVLRMEENPLEPLMQEEDESEKGIVT